MVTIPSRFETNSLLFSPMVNNSIFLSAASFKQGVTCIHPEYASVPHHCNVFGYTVYVWKWSLEGFECDFVYGFLLPLLILQKVLFIHL